MDDLSFVFVCVFFLMIRRPPRSTQSRSSAASDVYKRQVYDFMAPFDAKFFASMQVVVDFGDPDKIHAILALSLIHISEPTRPY